MTPLISVIVPIYQVKPWLEKCLKSILTQTYSNLEVICVDDASTDGSAELIRSYAKKDKRIRSIFFPIHKGVSAARNAGIDAATGDYIEFVDSDDWIDLNYIESMVDAAEKSGAEVVINQSIMCEYNGKSEIYRHENQDPFPDSSWLKIPERIAQIYFTAYNRLIRSDFLRKYDIRFPENCVYAEDLVFEYETFAWLNRVYMICGEFYHYRQRESSVCHTIINSTRYWLLAFECIYDYYKQHNLLDRKTQLYSLQYYIDLDSEELFLAYKNYFSKIAFNIDCVKSYTMLEKQVIRLILKANNLSELLQQQSWQFSKALSKIGTKNFLLNIRAKHDLKN